MTDQDDIQHIHDDIRCCLARGGGYLVSVSNHKIVPNFKLKWTAEFYSKNFPLIKILLDQGILFELFSFHFQPLNMIGLSLLNWELF